MGRTGRGQLVRQSDRWSTFMNLTRRFALIFFVLCITRLAGCEGKDPEPLSATVGGAIVGSNYTENGIQWFTVDGAGGDNLGASHFG